MTLDVNKLKGLAKDRTYNSRSGEPVTVKELKFELVEVKEPKVTYSTDKYNLVKTHFAALIQTKEERESQKKRFFVGNGKTFWTDGKITIPAKQQPAANANPLLDDDDDFGF